MALDFRRGRRRVSPHDFVQGLMDDAVEGAMEACAEEMHGKASSVVDPGTGKHAVVFVRRVGPTTLSIHTSGSPAFARALERRLGLIAGEVHGMNEQPNRERLVYLAHGSEDKAVARPLAEGLMRRGIDVWFDDWEIGPGDSLRRKMEQGLGDCTHFVVLLTPTSITKPWVNEEIDAGLMGAVEGTSKFMGLRHNLPLDAVSPLLRTRHTPALAPGEDSLEELAGVIRGLSRKPPLGEAPRYVQAHDPSSSWSAAARVVAEYMVRQSENATPHELQVTYEDIHLETGLPMPDVRIGVLDLVGAGLVKRSDEIGGPGFVSPLADLFVTFDAAFMPWDPERDARDLAVRLLNLDTDQAEAKAVAGALGWQSRRFNAAAAYLVSARVVKPIEYWGDDGYWPPGFWLGDELLRFVRSL